jgi:hypothetical protein
VTPAVRTFDLTLLPRMAAELVHDLKFLILKAVHLWGNNAHKTVTV